MGAAQPTALRHQGLGPRESRRLDRRVQPRPQTLLYRHAHPDRLRARITRGAAHQGRGMTGVDKPAPGTNTMAPSSPASRPSPPGGRWPALTPAAGGTGQHRSGTGKKEDQQFKIHLTEVFTVSGDCQPVSRFAALAGIPERTYRRRRARLRAGDVGKGPW